MLDEAVHLSPVPGVHAASPQVHVPSLTAVLSVLEQAGQGLALIWEGLYEAVLSIQACPQSIWLKAEAPSNTRRRRGRRRPAAA